MKVGSRFLMTKQVQILEGLTEILWMVGKTEVEEVLNENTDVQENIKY